MLQSGEQRRGNAARPAGEIHARRLDVGARDQLFGAADLLVEQHARAFKIDKPGSDFEKIVDARRRDPLRRHFSDRKSERLIALKEF